MAAKASATAAAVAGPGWLAFPLASATAAAVVCLPAARHLHSDRLHQWQHRQPQSRPQQLSRRRSRCGTAANVERVVARVDEIHAQAAQSGAHRGGRLHISCGGKSGPGLLEEVSDPFDGSVELALPNLNGNLFYGTANRVICFIRRSRFEVFTHF